MFFAFIYKIYISVVPLEAAPGSFIYLGKTKQNNFTAQIEVGKRYYYQLTAENSAQWSQRSEAIYLDVD